VTSLTDSLAQIRKVLRMSYYGGMSIVMFSLVFLEWHYTICLFQVSHMALNMQSYTYLLYLATSVDVEHVFSKGRLVLSHVRNRLSAQTTRALLCLGAWSLLGYVLRNDVLSVTCLPDLEEGEEEEMLGENWDMIV
jgi:hypothetical protein